MREPNLDINLGLATLQDRIIIRPDLVRLWGVGCRHTRSSSKLLRGYELREPYSDYPTPWSYFPSLVEYQKTWFPAVRQANPELDGVL